MLFDIVMEGLSCLVDRAVHRGYFSRFSVGTTSWQQLMVLHLLFADDTLIFCDADPDQLTSVCYVFTWFEAVSSLKINLGKSELVPVGEVSNMESLVDILGCQLGSLPMKYLGLPLGAGFKEKTIWNPILEDMWFKVDGFVSRIKLWWDSYVFEGSPSFILASKLKALKMDLKKWNLEEF